MECRSSKSSGQQGWFLLRAARETLFHASLLAFDGLIWAAWYSLLWQRRKDRRSGVIATDLSTGLMQRILFQSHLVPFSSVLH